MKTMYKPQPAVGQLKSEGGKEALEAERAPAAAESWLVANARLSKDQPRRCHRAEAHKPSGAAGAQS